MCKCAFNTCTKPGQLFVLGWFTFLYTGKQWGLNSRFKVFPIWFDLLHISSEWLKEYYVWNGWECARWFKAINMSLIRFICFFLFVQVWFEIVYVFIDFETFFGNQYYEHYYLYFSTTSMYQYPLNMEDMIPDIVCIKQRVQSEWDFSFI